MFYNITGLLIKLTNGIGFYKNKQNASRRFKYRRKENRQNG